MSRLRDADVIVFRTDLQGDIFCLKVDLRSYMPCFDSLGHPMLRNHMCNSEPDMNGYSHISDKQMKVPFSASPVRFFSQAHQFAAVFFRDFDAVHGDGSPLRSDETGHRL